MPIKNILLIQPPFQDFYQTEVRQQPLGLKYLQATLERAGYQVDLLDCLANDHKRTIPAPGDLQYLQPYYPPHDRSPFKLFTHFHHFGLSFQELGARLRILQPDLIGISINFTPYVDSALQVASICRSIFPETPIVVGGHHATAVPEHLLESSAIDFVILGEGEIRLLNLIESLEQNARWRWYEMDGLAFRSAEGIVVNPIQTWVEPLEQLPLINPVATSGMMITSRGCPGRCHFCSIAGVMGRAFRPRSIASVVEELDWGVRQGQREFDFEDDHLTCDRRRAKDLMRAIIHRFGENKLKLSAMNGLRPDTLDEELVQLLKTAGFEWLNLPLVSGSHSMQAKINRHQSQECFAQAVQWAQKHGLKVVGYLILGLPDDSIPQMIDDIIFLASRPLLIGPSLFYPAPGSLIFRQCVEKGYITGKDYPLYRSAAIPVETEQFSRRDLVTLFRLVRAINFLKHWIDQQDQSEVSLHQLLNQFPLSFESFRFHRKLTPEAIGFLLLKRLFEFGRLQGFTLKSSGKHIFEYNWLDYHISDDVVRQFLEEIAGRVISGIASSHRCLV